MTIIKTKKSCFSVNYAEDVLQDLFKKYATDSDFSDVLLQVDQHEIINMLEQAKLTILIAVEQIKDKNLIRALQTQADIGKRIYLLLGNEKENQTAIDMLSGRCLIRTGTSQKGASILLDHSTNRPKGLFVMNHQPFITSEQSSWAWGIELESNQFEDSYRSFCKLFWEHSQNEYLQQRQPETRVSHPNGNVVTNNAHNLSGLLTDQLYETLDNICGSSNFILEDQRKVHRLLLKTDNLDNVQLRQGTSLTDEYVPTLLLSDQNYWLLPDDVDLNVANWCLYLSEQQALQISNAYEKALDEASWQYLIKAEMKEFQSKQALRFVDQPEKIQIIEQQRNKELEAIFTETMDSFLNDSVEQLCESKTVIDRDFLAHRIDYTVSIHPPYCPQSVNADELYGQWNKTEQDWQKRISVLESKQEVIDDKQASIADKLKGFLKGFLLGQSQTSKKLNSELVELKSWSVSQATPAERVEYCSRLETLKDAIHSRDKNTVNEMDKAEQNHSWEQNKSNLECELQEAKNVLQKTNRSLESFNTDKPLSLSKIEDDFRKAYSNAIENLSDDKLKIINVNNIEVSNFLPDKMPEDKNKHKAIMKEANNELILAKKIALLKINSYLDVNKWRESLKEKKHISDINRACNNYKEGKKKIVRDLKTAQEEVDKAQRSLEDANKALQDHGIRFEYKANNNHAFEQQLGLNLSNKNDVSFNWPEEDLPLEPFELKGKGNKRWLIISDDNQLNLAYQEAERLNAILCINNPM